MPLDQNSLDRLKIDRSASASNSGGSRWWIPVLILLVLLFLGAWLWRESAGSGTLEVRLVTVVERGGEVSGGTVLNASGYVTARREATVSAKQMGKVVEVLVEEGKRVEANQVLARLDTSNLLASQRLSESQVASAQAALKETQAQLSEARQRYDRAKTLNAVRITSLSELEKAESDFKSLEARLARQEADVTVSRRSLEVLNQQMEDMTIRAPFSGIVTAKNAQPGEVISPMSAGGFTRTGICTLVDMESLEIEVDVNESFLNRVSPGQRVEATLDAYTDWKIPAKVIAIIPTADRQKATVRVRVGFDKLDPRILPQMGVKVAFRAAEQATPTSSTRTLTLARAALQERDGKQSVWMIKNGKAERRAIKTEGSGADTVNVIAGLSAGDRVIVDPPATLAEGNAVKERK